MKEYLKILTNYNEKTPFYITLSGITYPDPSYYITRLESDVSVIEYITEGEGYIEIDGKTHHVCKDMIYFLPQGKNHIYYSDSNNPFTKIFMNISGDFCDYIVSSYGLKGKYLFNGIGHKGAFERIVEIIRSQMPESQIQSALQGIFVEIISRLSLSVAENEYSEEAIKVKNFLDSNTERLVSTSELSRLIFRSPDYCQKLFKREFNTTPYAYQLDRKIQKAKFLLSETNMPIGEIAEVLGYTDLHYFSNLFLKKCGIRPLQYRKNKKL